MLRAALTAAAVLLPVAGGADDQSALARVFPRLTFERPLFITSAPGAPGQLYVVTQGGLVHTFARADDPLATAVFLDIRDRVTQHGGNEEGLLGLAFHPKFATNRTFYVYYSPADRPRRTLLSRFRALSAEKADADGEEVLLTIEQPYPNHKGGMLAFGPDGQLYVGVGDGGSTGDPQGKGQKLDTLLGKILRVTADGGVPVDNPFARNRNARGEIWAYGVRNPWRFSFDRETGELWLADVGQDQWEEIDLVQRGRNYGWNLFEGLAPYRNPEGRRAAGFVAPVHAYGHDVGCSVTGGYVYRGKAVPALAGRYVYADYCSGRVWSFAWDGQAASDHRQIATVPSPTSFGEDADGELYVTSFDGHVYRFGAAQ
jgi:glucose/arabinose dehydrogenase